MAPTEKAQQELEEIERQVAELEVPGADDATRRQIAKLQDRLETLRREMNAPPTAWTARAAIRTPREPATAHNAEAPANTAMSRASVAGSQDT